MKGKRVIYFFLLTFASTPQWTVPPSSPNVVVTEGGIRIRTKPPSTRTWAQVRALQDQSYENRYGYKDIISEKSKMIDC